ncbi:hypothetical protein [Cardinium endosymbiont of Tipula unca]|uniref:hypothetical protein n=1 Tax=Cardinium endosymbiont of Tipula unca TaxID=3066216 RepID=UPI0030D5FF84
MKDKWLCSSKVKGMALSLGVHLFFLGLVYYIQTDLDPGMYGNQSYNISLQPTIDHTVTNKKQTAGTNNPIEQEAQGEKSTLLEKKNVAKNQLQQPVKKKKKQTKKDNGLPKIKKQQGIAHKDQIPKIDDRGLYKADHTPSKQAGATLELAGWKWDKVPNPEDTSEECGKIVFEIKVDENGEIISIQTIEKTVTPMVEKIYADALRGLTFSKTSEVQPYSTISTGKVSFILVAK